MFKKTTLYFIMLGMISAQSFSIARIHYSGGGDWYSDPSSLPNLLSYLNLNTPMSAYDEEFRIKLTDDDANQYPYLYMTGHGNIRFTDDEVIALRSILMNGGFLHADDNYGMDDSFRREMKRVFPNKDFVTLPHDHPFSLHISKCRMGSPKYMSMIITHRRHWHYSKINE